MITSGINEQVPDYGLTLTEQSAFVPKLVKTSLKNVLFITIRDPKQGTKWCKLGKINDWIRRYSNNYYIVRGTAGGSHFHLLAIIKKDARKVKPQKGIHFHIQSMQREVFEFNLEDCTERRISAEKVVYFKEQTFDMLTLDMEPDSQRIITSIAAMIKSYWQRKQRKDKRLTRKDKQSLNYLRILVYMRKNLDEPRENGEDPELYKDFLYKDGQ